MHRLKTVLGSHLKVGDCIEFLGTFCTIDRFEPHPGIVWQGSHHPARVAVQDDGDVRITVFDDESYDVLK